MLTNYKYQPKFNLISDIPPENKGTSELDAYNILGILPKFRLHIEFSMNRKVLFIITVIIAFAPFILTRSSICDMFDFSSTGEIGDTIGGTTAPIIGLISIILLYLTLQEQIKFNRSQQIQSNEQAKIMREEQFKTTFFNLLQQQRDIQRSLQAFFYGLSPSDVSRKIQKKVYGQDFFAMAICELTYLFRSMESDTFYSSYDEDEVRDMMEYIYESCYHGLNLPHELEEENTRNINAGKRVAYYAYINDVFDIKEEDYNKYKRLSSIDEKILFVYDKFFSKRENSGYYFRHLYRILRFVEKTEKKEMKGINTISDRKLIEMHFQEYAQFVQAQMSTNEMLMVFYNSFSFPKLKRLVIKYRILENLTIENLISQEHCCIEEFNMKHRPEYRWNE